MVYVAKSNIDENDFLELLAKTRKLLLESLGSDEVMSPADFETAVYEKMVEAAEGTIFDGAIRRSGSHGFPDIVAKRYFGAEVKLTTGDHWVSTGNSILESSRVKEVERIYIIFGKFGGKFDVKYRLYQECLAEVSVTHSPRYRINMDLAVGKSIFDKMGVRYDDLRKESNPIRTVKDYYKKQLREGEELWWIGPESEEKSVSLVIRQFGNFTPEEKESFILESMIFFPEVFGNGGAKFERAAAYLIGKYNAVSASLRDSFSAGGQESLKIKGRAISVPRVAHNLYERAKAVSVKLRKIDAATLAYYWRVEKINKDRLAQWKNLLDEIFPSIESNVKLSDIFEAGCDAKDEELS